MTELPVDPKQPTADDDLEPGETELDHTNTTDTPEDTNIPDDEGDAGTDQTPHDGEDDELG